MERREKHFYEFGEFRIDTRENQLLRAGRPVAVTPKLFDLLLLLVENKGHTLTKDEVMRHMWPGTFVEENNLSRNISMLRKLLGDDLHDSRFIKTIPKRGYRFEPEVHEVLEDDEELVIEKRNRYSVALRTEAESDKVQTALFSPRLVIAGSAVAVLIVAAFVWMGGSRQQSAGAASAESERKATFRGASNAEAFDLYRRGRDLWQSRSAGGLHEATLLLEQAVERDPNFALAHAALADAYVFDTWNWKKAEATAKRAIELDPNLGEPHATIGFINFFWEWDPAEAEVNYKKSIALSPDYATAHQWYATLLVTGQRYNQAIAEIDRAIELDPAALAARADRCQILYFVGRYDDAETECKKVLEIDPNFFSAHLHLQDIYTALGRYDDAVSAFFATEGLTANFTTLPEHIKPLKNAFDSGGIRAFWQARVGGVDKKGRGQGVVAAKYYALLGDNDAALDALDAGYRIRDFSFPLIFSDPVLLKCCAADPRFKKLSNLWWSPRTTIIPDP